MNPCLPETGRDDNGQRWGLTKPAPTPAVGIWGRPLGLLPFPFFFIFFSSFESEKNIERKHVILTHVFHETRYEHTLFLQ